METSMQSPADYPMVAKTFQGLEEILAQELISLGAKNVEIGNRMVQFEGDLELMYKANLCCRTALRILKPIAKFTAEDEDELYDRVRDFDWSLYLTPHKTFAIDATVNGSIFTHSQYAGLRVKDGIADYFLERDGKRPSVRVENPDLMLNVHISDNRVTISLDSSGEPLCKRGYKVENTKAPINEVLAAGIILMTGWRGDVDFMDPMCGSGTFLTEAAMIAANINPGIYREGFAFEKWTDFDSDLFERLYNDDSQEREVNIRITGSDIDPIAVNIAKANIRNARLERMISVECIPMEDVDPSEDKGILVTNPPYGKRLRPGDVDSLWKRIGTTLKHNFAGWHAWIIGMTDEQFAELGFKPTVKIPLHNGSLECSLREYELFKGTYDAFRSQGKSVKHRKEEVDMPEIRRSKRMSRHDWEQETEKFGTGGKPRKMREEREPGGRRNFGKHFHREDSKGFKKNRFREEDGDSFQKDNFKKDRAGFKKEGFRKDREGFKKEGFKKDKEGFKKEFRSREPRSINDRGPRLSEANEMRFETVRMRPRRKPDIDNQNTDSDE